MDEALLALVVYTIVSNHFNHIINSVLIMEENAHDHHQFTRCPNDIEAILLRFRVWRYLLS